VHGDLQVNSGGTLSVAYYGAMTIEQDGVAVIYGTLSSTYYGLIDVFGYLGVAADGYLHVYPNGQINVYNDILVSGRMTGGGKIVCSAARAHPRLQRQPDLRTRPAYGFARRRRVSDSCQTD
jgi:hypothetical protein